jgi:hypothetical protein
MPQIAKRSLPADFSNSKGSLKKAKANSAAIQNHDDEEYGSAINKVITGVQTGIKAKKKPKVEVKEETKPKVENDAKVQTVT